MTIYLLRGAHESAGPSLILKADGGLLISFCCLFLDALVMCYSVPRRRCVAHLWVSLNL